MPIYDVICTACNRESEIIGSIHDEMFTCPTCGGQAKKIISLSKTHSFINDAPWLPSVLEVVDKEGGPHCQRFLHSPTRANYKAWMKGENIVPMEKEHGAFATENKEPEDLDIGKMTDEVMKMKQERERLTVR